MDTYRITEEQKAYLNSLVCQRLTADPDNEFFLDTFENNINCGLANNIKNGWQEDKKGETAYYIVKDEEDRALFYFSLRCGTLYKPGLYQRVEALYRRARTLRGALLNWKSSPRWAVQELEKYREDGEIPQYIHDEINNQYERMKAAHEIVEAQMDEDPSAKAIPVDKSYAGIEVVHFVKNTNYSEIWKQSCASGRSIGEVVFWKVIMEIIKNLNCLVGCGYVYLFAANLGNEEKLIKFYQDNLHFIVPENIGVFKPRYDVGCAFMCQKVSDLLKYREKFFENFNAPEVSN